MWTSPSHFRGLHMMIEQGDIRQLRSHLERGEEDPNNNAPSNYRHHLMTPLGVACRRGDLEAVKLLIKHKALVEVAGNSDGETPIYIAASKGHTQLAEYLLQEENALVNARSNIGWTALHSACRNNHTKMTKTLLRGGVSALVFEECLTISSERGGASAKYITSWRRFRANLFLLMLVFPRDHLPASCQDCHRLVVRIFDKRKCFYSQS